MPIGINGERLFILTPQHTHTIACALRVASEQYRADARTHRVGGSERMVEQFTRQADQCDALAVQMEDNSP